MIISGGCGILFLFLWSGGVDAFATRSCRHKAIGRLDRDVPFRMSAARRGPEEPAYDNYDDDENDDDDVYYDTRMFSENPEVERLRNMPYEGDYYNEDDTETSSEKQQQLTPRRSRQAENDAFWQDEDEDDSYYYEDEYEDDDDDYDEDDDYDFEEDNEGDDDTGNFWSNPPAGLDSINPEQQRSSSSRRRRPPMSSPSRRSRRRRKTTFRSGTPAPPSSITEIYDKLFFGGLDGVMEVPLGTDKTRIGGTRGKFDGLTFLEDAGFIEPTPKRRRRRRLSPIFDEEQQEYNDDDDNYDDYEDGWDDNGYDDKEPDEDAGAIATPSTPRRPRSRAQRPRIELEEEEEEESDDDEEQIPEMRRRRVAPRRRRRQQQRRRGRPPPRRNRKNDWVTDEVSTWFQGDGQEQDNNGWFGGANELQDRRRQRQRKQNPFSASVTKFMDDLFKGERGFFDDDEDDDYGRPRRKRRRQRRAPVYDDDDDWRRNDDDDDEEWDSSDDWEDDDNGGRFDGNGVVDAEIEDERRRKKKKKKKQQPEWEGLKSQLERVPPPNVPAWGPSGELGIDARTKAALDALQEIREGREKVELKKHRTREAQEEMVVLRA